MALGRRNKVIVAVFIGTAVLALTGVALLFSVLSDLPDIGDVKSVVKNQTSYIYAADGTPITRLYQENRTIVPLKQISPNLQKAVIAVEDQRFYDHRGVDFIRIIGALIKDIRSGEAAQGGSTITQQYVKNAYFSPEKTITRKLREAFLAMELERNYTKEEILEKYLNTIYFGNRSYGIEAASQSYFGIPASKLNVEQSALLAGLIKAPEAYNPYKNPSAAQNRRNIALNLMAEEGYITKAQAETIKPKPLAVITSQQSYQGIAPYYAEWIKTELSKLGFDEQAIYSQGLRIYTTLDRKMQDNAERAWKRYLPSASDPDVAIVAIDPKTGAVKTMVGGKNFNKDKFNVAAQAPGRQPGSSFKPFTLAAGLMNGVSPDDGFESSSPQTFKVPGTSPWIVHNYSGESGAGYTNLRQATARSINVVFAGLIMKVGVEPVVDVAKKLGVTSEVNPNPAITLGGVSKGLTPLEMASAYATFANNGKYNKPYGIQKINMPDGQTIYEHKLAPEQRIDEAVAALTNDVLKGVVNSGTGTRARIGRPAAGKTGTTQKYVDAWFVGYTPDLAASVWVGYRGKNRPMTSVHGIRVAGGTFPAQIWSSFMRRSLEDVKASDFEDPPSGSLTYMELCDDSNLLPTEFCPDVSKHVYVKKYKPKVSKRCDLHKAIPVPDLIGMTRDEAIAALTKAKLGSSVKTRGSGAPAGQVVESNPPAGTDVKEGTIVEIFLSDGQGDGQSQGQQVSVPGVIGMSSDQAVSVLEGNGFSVSEESRPSDAPQGQVIDQNPPGGNTAPSGSTVTIYVSGSNGSGDENVRVPNVIGRGEARARAALESRGLNVIVFNDTSPQNIQRYGIGTVSNQNPTPGSRTARGARVVIYVTTQG